nr:hypothetical protein [Actinomycetota bacterium]
TRYNPTSTTDTWTDVTTRVRGALETSRGKEGEAEHAETGSMILTLTNDDRALEPEYAASPYYPGVASNRKIQIRAFHDGVWKPLWRGYVEQWPQTWGLRRSAVTLSCVGNFIRFSHAEEVSGDFPTELTGARVDRVLDAAAVPSTERLLDEGKLALVAHRVERSGTRGYADQAVDSEFGILFEDAYGRIAFHDRDHRVTDERSVVPRFVLGDGGPSSGELPLVFADPTYDPDRVVNDVRVEWPGGVTQVAVDGASVRSYGQKSITVQTLLGSELSAARLAKTILDLAHEPRWRFPQVSIRPTRLEELWFVALDSEISDRHVIRRRPPGGGALLQMPVFVEAVRHSIEMGSEGHITDWLTTFAYSTVGRALPVALIPFTTVSVAFGTMGRTLPPTAGATASRLAPFIKTSRPKPNAAVATASRPAPLVLVGIPIPVRVATAARVAPVVTIS